MRIISFDIGIKNLCFCIETFDNDKIKCINDCINNGKIELFVNKCLTTNQKTNITDICILTTNHLNEYEKYFDHLDYIIIEKQMGFVSKINIKAVQLSQHIMTYFMIKYPQSICQFINASHKFLQLDDEEKKIKRTYAQRKKWSINKCYDILNSRNDTKNISLLNNLDKKDDVADTIVQLVGFKIKMFVNKRSK